ncbi:MAG: hypothetical protein ACK52I_14745 [Pseudomonadota bacterium]|jgi:hypothetical protein
MWALDARTEPTTLLAVVDPTDTVRALARTANVPTLPYATLLGEIDRASGRAGPAARRPTTTRPRRVRRSTAASTGSTAAGTRNPGKDTR